MTYDYAYGYAIIRVVPKVKRGEFINVGMTLSCRAQEFLEAQITSSERRMRSLDASLVIKQFVSILLQFQRFVRPAITLVRSHNFPSGYVSIGRSRLAAPSSRLHPAHIGLCTISATAPEHLLIKLVQAPQ